MAQATYEVTVKLPNGNNERVMIEASSHRQCQDDG